MISFMEKRKIRIEVEDGGVGGSSGYGGCNIIGWLG